MNDFSKLHATYERKAFIMLLRAFRDIGNSISFDALTPENAPTLVALAVNTDNVREALFRVHMTIGKSYGMREARALRKEMPRTVKAWKPLPLFNTAFQKFLLSFYKTFGGERIKILSETYVKTVVDEIRKSTEQNERVEVMRDRIKKAVNKPDFYKWQALRIARTETTFAMNSAKEMAGEVSGATMEKIWIGKIDGRERASHRAMNGTKVGQNEMFDVNGSKMKFPGDGTNGAGVEELANCRCTFGYVALRDANGEIIWND